MNDRKVNSEVLGVLTVLGDEYTSLIPEDIMEYFETTSNSNLSEKCIWANFIIKFYKK